MRNRILKTIFAVLILTICFTGCSCSKKKDKDINPNLDLKTPVTLKIATSSSSWEALDTIITMFEKKYPNCSVSYELVVDYENKIQDRLANNNEDLIDVFTSSNIQPSISSRAGLIDYAVNLLEESETLDLSDTHSGLVDNFKVYSDKSLLYAIPYGGEMRGMYVNKTLLKKYNLEVPTNLDEFMNCCKVLKTNGYIPLQSPTSTCAQQMLYPYICNLIVNNPDVDYETMYNKVNNLDAGISEYFRSAYEVMYNIVSNGYYNNELATNNIAGYSSSSKAQRFLNIFDTNGDGTFEKINDTGVIAFIPDTQSMRLSLEELSEDYNSKIEYEFIMSPVSDEGGYTYLSPTEGFAVNKNSLHKDWALEFLDFLFTAENNKVFNEIAGKLPNTSDALEDYSGIDESRTCHLGQVTFDYNFYTPITNVLGNGVTVKENEVSTTYVGISKMNYASSMVDDGNNGKKFAYTLDEYMQILENQFQALKK